MNNSNTITMNEYEIEVSLENKTRKSIFEYLKRTGQINLEKNVEDLIDTGGGFIDRFNYFMPLINNAAKNKLLVSGCSIGSEMIVAKKFGFNEIYGTEVTNEYVAIAKERLKNDSSMHVDFYTGEKLPYEDESFSMICSGHIIEHTRKPSYYLKEHLRVLKKGGFFFIEFPNRYNAIELHTGEKSFEWLPLLVRNYLLRYLSRKNPAYGKILKGLKPVSIWQIRFYCFFSKHKGVITNIQIPAPGYVRMIIKKI